MFQESRTQHKAYERLTTVVEKYLEGAPPSDGTSLDEADNDSMHRQQLIDIDRCMLTFAITLVERHTPKDGFCQRHRLLLRRHV